ncbi:TetR/AcrR family transcriptional regulator [Amycolatopsis sp. WGS_07]|uniref:TetR/AcrR family transcriptional regulator n=1 Tax=Amycolatopsis sp. WGS_07 TaxID=3076764 RepID=UPI003873B338
MSTRNLRAELIAAAVAKLAEPQAVAVPSLRSIARDCRVAPSAVYWHFPSEADLRSAILDAVYTDLVEHVEQAIAATPERAEPVDRLVAAGQAYVRWGLAHPGAYQLLFESGDPVPETRAPTGPRLQDRIVGLVAAADPETPFSSALLLWSAYHGLVSLRLHKPHWDWGSTADEAAARVVTAMVASFANP